MSLENVNVKYSEVNDWGKDFQGKIKITNNTGSNIDSWDLEFDLPQEITNIWDAQIVSQDGERYTIKHESWNREIAAGETITIGFTGSGDNDDDTPGNFDIDGSTFNSPSSSDSIFTSSNENLSSDLSLGETYQGRATFYDAANPAGGKVASGRDNLSDDDDLAKIAAINNTQWNGGEAVGGFFEVSGPKQREGSAPIVVEVVDILYERADGLDLSAEAFEKVADPVDGVVNIEYELISPPDNFQTGYDYTIGQGIVVEGIEGSNPYYAAFRLNNHRHPVESVELLKEDGSKQAFERDTDRYSLGTSNLNGPQDLLVTDIFGQQVTLDDINITNGSSADVVTGEQFSMV